MLSGYKFRGIHRGGRESSFGYLFCKVRNFNTGKGSVLKARCNTTSDFLVSLLQECSNDTIVDARLNDFILSLS